MKEKINKHARFKEYCRWTDTLPESGIYKDLCGRPKEFFSSVKCNETNCPFWKYLKK